MATSSATFAPSDVPPITALSSPRCSSSASTSCSNWVIEYSVISQWLVRPAVAERVDALRDFRAPRAQGRAR